MPSRRLKPIQPVFSSPWRRADFAGENGVSLAASVIMDAFLLRRCYGKFVRGANHFISSRAI
jgi:hypothetical protein